MSKLIFDLGDDAPWIERKGNINKAALNFSTKFWWTMVCFRLCLIVADNLLTWYRDVLIVSLISRYEIDFAAIISYELHERAFKDLTILPIPCLIQ